MIRFNKNGSDDDDDKVLLEESFYVSANKKNVFHVKLSERGLVLTKSYKDGKQKSHLIPIEHILGVCCLKFRPTKAICLCGGSLKTQQDRGRRERLGTDANDAYLYIYTYITKDKRSDKSCVERNTIALRFRSFDKYEQNADEANKWRSTILMLMNQSREAVFKRHFNNKGYLIFLNPKSGKGKARDIFHKIVAPVLADADIQFDLYITKSANFARQFVRTKNLQQWSTVIGNCSLKVLLDMTLMYFFSSWW